MPRTNDYRVVLIDPKRLEESVGELANLLPEVGNLGEVPRNFRDLPLLAVIEEPSGLPNWQVALFLGAAALRSNSICGDSVRTYAESLIPWLRYLRDRQLALEDVDEETYGLYRAIVSNQRISVDERYSSATVNLRILVPELFHAWAQERDVIDSPFGAYLLETGHAPGAAQGVNRRKEMIFRSRPRSRTIKRLPVSLSEEETRRIIQLAPMPYRLMWKWAVATGLRRFEICGLERSVLPRPQQVSLSDDRLVSFPLLRKGSREVSVYAPVALVEETNWYILAERPKARNRRDEAFVFLSDDGNAISRQSMSKEFRKVANKIGSKSTLHHLRHTFAMKVYGLLEKHRLREEEINPLKALQVLLGHAHVETSEIYVQSASIANEVVMKALESIFEG